MTGENDGSGDVEGTPSGFFELVEAAELEARGGRIGRPKGARNRKSVDFEKWFHAAGFKDPAVLLAEIISADALALGRAASIKVAEALELQRKCATDLMPYLHGKKPIEIDLVDERLPSLFIISGDNQLAQAQKVLDEQRRLLSIGSPLIEGEANEIKGLEGDE